MSDGSAEASDRHDAQADDTALEALTDEILPALIARLRRSRMGELEVRGAGWRIRLRRDPRAAAATAETAVDSDAGQETDPEIAVARSTAVGYFSPAPETIIGRSVREGDRLGTVDVLGIFQDVTSPSDGVISRVLADAGEAVEYGQPLVLVDPLEAEADAAGDDVGRAAD